MKKIAAITFGSKVNQYETACIVDEFAKHSYEAVDFSQDADVYVINSCTVTNRTDFKSRNAIRKALQHKVENPDVKIIVTGCYAQRNYDEIKKLGDIDFVIDNNKKGEIYNIFENNNSQCFENILMQKKFSELSTTSFNEKSRAFIKVQDGCDYYCTYCAIPYARGHSRSRKKENVLHQIEILVQNGYKEFVLGGINLGLYGLDLYSNYTLSDLLFDMEKFNGVEIIRLSSIEPNLFNDKMLDYFRKSKKISHHFHIPLQSGSNEILKKMKRRYTTELFETKINMIKEIFPDAAFGFDVICGFPSETDELFMQTLDFLDSIDFTYLHIFIYSRRKDTPAAKLKNFVNGEISKQRSHKLNELSKSKTEKYIDKLISNKTPLAGIIETEIDGYKTALSDHYIRIYMKTEKQKQKHVQNLIPQKRFKDGVLVKI